MAIVKILSRHTPSYGSLINYILQKDRNNKLEVITHNLRSNTIDAFVKEFIQNEAFRKASRSDQVYLYHEILSFSAKENKESITPEIMNDLMREYIRLRGVDKVVVGAVHRDNVEHVHAHFCVSGLSFRTGKSARLSKSELLQLKTDFQEYHKEKYPFLSQSEPEHGQNNAVSRIDQWQTKRKEQRTLVKQQLESIINKAFEASKTQNEFLAILKENGYHHYERNGKITGVEVDENRYRFSRLMEIEKFERLPLDSSEEERALEEITAIREMRQEKDSVRDIEDLEQ